MAHQIFTYHFETFTTHFLTVLEYSCDPFSF